MAAAMRSVTSECALVDWSGLGRALSGQVAQPEDSEPEGSHRGDGRHLSCAEGGMMPTNTPIPTMFTFAMEDSP